MVIKSSKTWESQQSCVPLLAGWLSQVSYPSGLTALLPACGKRITLEWSWILGLLWYVPWEETRRDLQWWIAVCINWPTATFSNSESMAVAQIWAEYKRRQALCVTPLFLQGDKQVFSVLHLQDNTFEQRTLLLLLILMLKLTLVFWSYFPPWDF